MPPTGRPAERRLAAVERALRVLDAFLRVRVDAGTSELARLTGINASTVSRMLSTLVDAGYVEHVPETGRYLLGTHLLALSNHVLAGLDLRVLARPHLEALEAEVGETSTLSLPSSPDAITVDFVPSRETVASLARIGRPSIAHATATGKVMLDVAGGRLRARPLDRLAPGQGAAVAGRGAGRPHRRQDRHRCRRLRDRLRRRPQQLLPAGDVRAHGRERRGLGAGSRGLQLPPGRLRRAGLQR